ncbi:hypothetical protein P154DRAFT_443540 [Amniculicola lignicola CBS 123094]|uniref:RING-type domain-containing protein n=1 Tax=Amniculicola lignicola CBS 123094 TaxID=1392246 RepID=A0A6A5W353_9PLEO|nr:hypothetical protein P154DRAFT_443540 [Amniculicola lignicola CBS 123094]
MDNLPYSLFITSECFICQGDFGPDHTPVALACRHIFGRQCLLHWLQQGQGNVSSCPQCRAPLSAEAAQGQPARAEFTSETLWDRCCEMSSYQIDTLMYHIWKILDAYQFWPENINVYIHDLFMNVIRSSFEDASRQMNDLLFRGIHLQFHGRTQAAQGVIPSFNRLVLLMLATRSKFPKTFQAEARTNMLIFKASACFGRGGITLYWECLNEASLSRNDRYFPFLHFYTMLVSQNVEYHPKGNMWPELPQEQLAMVVDRCCNRIGRHWDGRPWEGVPSDEFKNKLVAVYHELQHHQHGSGRVSLRGNEGEEDIVRGLWRTGTWNLRATYNANVID